MNTHQKKVNFFKNLRENKKTRAEFEQVLITGNKMVEELALKHSLKTLILLQNTPIPPKLSYQELFFVTAAEMKKITGLQAPEEMAASVAIPQVSDISDKKWVLILDRLSDPGNVGTLIRSAKALFFEAFILIEGTADPFNDKALRAAKGATFELPFAIMTPDACIKWLEKHRFLTLVADLSGKDPRTQKYLSPLALVLGSESHGPQEGFKKSFEKVKIPMHPQINSLNVATAGSILMFTLRGADL